MNTVYKIKNSKAEEEIAKQHQVILSKVCLLVDDIETLKDDSNDSKIKDKFFYAIESSLECLQEVEEKLGQNQDEMESEEDEL